LKSHITATVSVIATITLVMGLIGLFISFIPIIGVVALKISIPACIVGGIGVIFAYKQKSPKGYIAGATTVAVIGAMFSYVQYSAIKADKFSQQKKKKEVAQSLTVYIKDRSGGLEFALTGRSPDIDWRRTLGGLADGVYKVYYKSGQLAMKFEVKSGKRDGCFKKWYPNEKTQKFCLFKNGENHGIYRYYFKNGQLGVERKYKNGLRNGREFDWREDGTKEDETDFINDKMHGIRKEWDKKGNIISKKEYMNGHIYRDILVSELIEDYLSSPKEKIADKPTYESFIRNLNYLSERNNLKYSKISSTSNYKRINNKLGFNFKDSFEFNKNIDGVKRKHEQLLLKFEKEFNESKVPPFKYLILPGKDIYGKNYDFKGNKMTLGNFKFYNVDADRAEKLVKAAATITPLTYVIPVLHQTSHYRYYRSSKHFFKLRIIKLSIFDEKGNLLDEFRDEIFYYTYKRTYVYGAELL
jgi:MORN repeat variant